MNNSMLEIERGFWERGVDLVAGIDESGRGPLAGPVVSAAVVFRKGDYIEGVDDSKKLTARKREKLFDLIKGKALSYSVGIVSERDIDKINILKATLLSMSKAVDGLTVEPEFLLVDGRFAPETKYHSKTIVNADELSFTVAAASIIAKVTRDRIMIGYDVVYPAYLFKKNKGYGTREHIAAIRRVGLSPIHRRTFCRRILRG